jgi:hypothetical protein
MTLGKDSPSLPNPGSLTSLLGRPKPGMDVIAACPQTDTGVEPTLKLAETVRARRAFEARIRLVRRKW